MTTHLFREEALRSFETSPWQPPLLSAPVSGLLVLLFVGSAVGAILGFASSFEFSRKEQAHGHLTPAAGWTRVAATSFGVVQRRLVQAGDHVDNGDVLLELTPVEGLRKGLTVQAMLLEEVQAQLALLESQEQLLLAQYRNNLRRLHREHSLAEEDLVSLEQELDLHRSQLHSAEQRFNDGQRLSAQGALAAADVRGLLDTVRALAVSVAEKERTAGGIRSSLAGVGEKRHRLALDLAMSRAGIRERLHDLAMREYRIRGEGAARILAPRDGVVASIRVEAGDRVAPGGWLLDILPHDGLLRARLFASSIAIGNVDVGQMVRVHLDAFPYERHGAQLGRIISISESSLEDPGGSGESSFQVDVEFPKGFALRSEHLTALRPGMTVTADFLGARGTLLDWALEPLRGATERI